MTFLGRFKTQRETGLKLPISGRFDQKLENGHISAQKLQIQKNKMHFLLFDFKG